MTEPELLRPESLEEALALLAERGDEVTVLAGGTFVGILMNQGLLLPAALLSLRRVPGLDGIAADGDLRLGALATHRAIERSDVVHARNTVLQAGGWPALAETFARVASPRVRNRATVGGVLADADYASDPPAMLVALGATVVARSAVGERTIPVDELIVGHYETVLRPEELLVEVRVPGGEHRAVYRKFRSRSHEDRPCVGVAACVRPDGVRVVVGAVAERPQLVPELCALADRGLTPELCAEIGRGYAEAIEPLADLRGSAAYRRRVIAVEVRRALEALT